MNRVVSGVRPTGDLHLGNYFGAIKNFVSLQDQMECFFFIADYHSLTTHPKPADLHANVKAVLATYLACGLDPDKTTLYVQSDLPQIPELFLILNMLAYKGELERSTTYKDKVSKQKNKDAISAGLLTYPILMAADVIIHKATQVPVGKDQEQHMEMARNFVNRFNHMYEVDYFPEPHGFNFGDNLVKIPSLDGMGKMGKSEAAKGTIFLNESDESIRKKIMKAKSDSGPAEEGAEMSDAVQNLFTLMNAVSTEDTVAHFKQAYENASIRYGDMKKQLAEDTITFVRPIRERMEEMLADEPYLAQVLAKGAAKAQESAEKTIKEVREIIGIKRF